MPDAFSDYSRSLTAPLSDGFDITPNDTGELREVTRAVYVGQGGDLAVEMADGGSIVLRDLKPGVVYPLRLAKVLSTSTTAANVVGMV